MRTGRLLIGLFGVGGGFLVVPALVVALQIPIRGERLAARLAAATLIRSFAGLLLAIAAFILVQNLVVG